MMLVAVYIVVTIFISVGLVVTYFINNKNDPNATFMQKCFMEYDYSGDYSLNGLTICFLTLQCFVAGLLSVLFVYDLLV